MIRSRSYSPSSGSLDSVERRKIHRGIAATCVMLHEVFRASGSYQPCITVESVTVSGIVRRMLSLGEGDIVIDKWKRRWETRL